MPRHHVVPQLMLRRFADASERLVMADRDTPHRSFTTKVRTAAAENGFYRIAPDDVEDGHRDNHDPELVERALSDVEGAAAGPLGDLIAGRFPTLEDRFRIALLVALQAVRGQGFRADMERIATLSAKTRLRATITDDRIRGWLIEQGHRVDQGDINAFRAQTLSEDGWSLRMPQAVAVQESLRFGFEVIQPRLFLAAWEIWTYDDPVLLTSDAPVAPWSPPRPDGLPVGIANAKHVYLPLDRRTVLVITDRPQAASTDRQVRQTSPALIARVNHAVASGAHRWIYHHPHDTPLEGIQVEPRQRWTTEQATTVTNADGTVTVRGMYVRRPALPPANDGVED